MGDDLGNASCRPCPISCPETELLTSSIRLRENSSLASQPISRLFLLIQVGAWGRRRGAKMSRSLSPKRNFEDIRKEARELLRDLQRWDAAAIKRHYSLDCEAGRFRARLADAQYIVAREYGYGSWQKLKLRLEAKLQDIIDRRSPP
jgi:hypothetical protein